MKTAGLGLSVGLLIACFSNHVQAKPEANIQEAQVNIDKALVMVFQSEGNGASELSNILHQIVGQRLNTDLTVHSIDRLCHLRFFLSSQSQADMTDFLQSFILLPGMTKAESDAAISCLKGLANNSDRQALDLATEWAVTELNMEKRTFPAGQQDWERHWQQLVKELVSTVTRWPSS